MTPLSLYRLSYPGYYPVVYLREVIVDVDDTGLPSSLGRGVYVCKQK
jgi:hypothetical protein